MAFWNLNAYKKAVPDRNPKEAPSQPSIMYLNSGVGVAMLQWNDSVAAKEGLTHPVVARAIDKIASSVAQVRWFIEEDPYAQSSDKTVDKIKIEKIQTLLDDPNSEMTPSMLRYWMAQNYALYGRVPVNITFSAVEPMVANGIYPLQVDQVYVQTNTKGIAENYDYGTTSNSTRFVSRSKWKPGTKGGLVDQIWKPSLRGFQHPEERNSPLHSLGLPIQVIKSLMVRAIRAAEGHPNVRYMVTCSKLLTSDQQEILRKYLNKDHGPEGISSGQVPVLMNASDVTIHKLDNDLSDIHSKVPLDDMARLVYGAFGIPISIMGIGAADSAKFSGNFDGSRNAFWQDTIIPSYVSPLFEGLSRILCPVGYRISPDLDSIPSLVAGRVLSMKEIEGVSFLTETEKRDLFGFKEIPQPAAGKPTPPPANPKTPTGASNEK